jgi:hypothetical protein
MVQATVITIINYIHNMFMVHITTVAEDFSNNNVVYLWQCDQPLNCVYIGEGSAIMPATMTRDSDTHYLPWPPCPEQQR